MSKIQDFFIGKQKYIDIPPGEYEGPLIISHSCIVDFHGATLWSKEDNYPLVIDAYEVAIKNLRVELLGNAQEFTAIKIKGTEAQLVNVEVFGGISEPNLGEVSKYNLPRTINLGTFAANNENAFLIRLDGVKENYRVLSSVYGLKVEPQNLFAPNNELRLTVQPMRDGNILYGNLILEFERRLWLSSKPSRILHRIYISGRAQTGAEIKTAPKIQTAPPQQVIAPESQPTVPLPKPTVPIPKPTSNKIQQGQKISAPNSENLSVIFRAANLPNDMTIDAGAFCLGKNNKVLRDTDFIFFNNPRHESFGVALNSKKNTPGIDLNLKNLPAEIQSVVVFFSIYDEGNRAENNFSSLILPEVVVIADENIACEFPINLGHEKIFKALEFYRDNGAWKIHFIGLGAEKNLEKLCETYGVEVF